MSIIAVIGNIITRFGGDASQLSSECKKAQNTILTFKNESFQALKSFGTPRIVTTDLVDSIKSSQRTIVDFTRQGSESLAQFQQRVRTIFREAGIDFTQYEAIIKTATGIHAEFANGAVRNFQSVADSSRTSTSSATSSFTTFKNSMKEAFATMGDSSKGFGEKLMAAGGIVTKVFPEIMAVIAALTIVKTISGWIDKLEEFAIKCQDASRRFTTSMGVMSDEALKFSEDLSSKLGVPIGEIKNDLAMMNLNLLGLGFNTTSAKAMSESLVQLSYDLGKMRGEAPADVFAKFMTGVEGQTRGLKSLGIMISDVDIMNRALAEGIVKVGDTLNDQQKSQMIYEELMNKGAFATGAYARSQNDLSSMSVKLSDKFEEMKKTLAKSLIPVFEVSLQAALVLARGLGVVVNYLAGFLKAIQLIVSDVFTFYKALFSWNFSNLGKDLKANYENIYNNKNAIDANTNSVAVASAKAQEATIALAAKRKEEEAAIKAAKEATKELNAKEKADLAAQKAAERNAAVQKKLAANQAENVQGFDQVHNLTDAQTAATEAQTTAVNKLADALNNSILSTGVNPNTGMSNEMAPLKIPLTADIPNFWIWLGQQWDKFKKNVFVPLWALVSPFVDWVVNQWDYFKKTVLVPLWALVSPFVDWVVNQWDYFKKTVLVPLWADVTKFANEVMNAIKGFLKAEVKLYSEVLAFVSGVIIILATKAITKAVTLVHNITNFITNAAHAILVSATLTKGVALVHSLTNFITNAAHAILKSASLAKGVALVHSLNNFITNAASAILRSASLAKGVALVHSLTNFITNAAHAILNSSKLSKGVALVHSITNFIANAASWLRYSAWLQVGVHLFHEVANFITNAAYWLKNSAWLQMGVHLIADFSNFITGAIANGKKASVAVIAWAHTFFGFAEGGIITAPTLGLIGEGKEAEAVLPLSKLDSMLSNKAKLGETSNVSGGNQPINVTLNLDGRKLARVLYQYNINEESRIGSVQGYNPSFNYAK